MRTSIFLKLSLAANSLLLALLLAPRDRESQPSPSAAPPPAGPVFQASAEGKSVHPDPARPATWTESLSALRRVGVPSAIIAKLVVEKVAQKWTPIETELEQKYLHGEIDAKRLAELNDQRAREQEAELRAALGDGFLAWDMETTVTNMYLGGLVPAEEQKRPLYDLQKSHLARLHALEVAQREGRIDLATFEITHAHEVLEYKTGLAALIGAERVDGLAPAESMPQMRADFARLGLASDQMRDLAAIHEKWSAARSDMARSLEETAHLDSAYEGDLRALDQARDAEYARVLGQERFDAWRRAADDRHRLMRQNAEAWQLDGPTISSVYSDLRAYDLAVANREYQAQLREQAGETVDWARVQSDVAAYSRDTETTLRARLGDERFARLSEAAVISLRQPDLAKSALGERPHL